MKTFLVLEMTSGFALIMAASSTSRDAFLSRGDVVVMGFGPVWFGGRIGVAVGLGKTGLHGLSSNRTWQKPTQQPE